MLDCRDPFLIRLSFLHLFIFARLYLWFKIFQTPSDSPEFWFKLTWRLKCCPQWLRQFCPVWKSDSFVYALSFVFLWSLLLFTNPFNSKMPCSSLFFNLFTDAYDTAPRIKEFNKKNCIVIEMWNEFVIELLWSVE